MVPSKRLGSWVGVLALKHLYRAPWCPHHSLTLCLGLNVSHSLALKRLYPAQWCSHHSASSLACRMAAHGPQGAPR